MNWPHFDLITAHVSTCVVHMVATDLFSDHRILHKPPLSQPMSFSSDIENSDLFVNEDILTVLYFN